MAVIELAELRFFWQQRAPAGHRLQHIIQRVADKYEFSADERIQIGKALQEFADELLAVHGRIEARKSDD
jgi:hypothetical protein